MFGFRPGVCDYIGNFLIDLKAHVVVGGDLRALVFRVMPTSFRVNGRLNSAALPVAAFCVWPVIKGTFSPTMISAFWLSMVRMFGVESTFTSPSVWSA